MSEYTNFEVGQKFPLPIATPADGAMFQVDANGTMFILQLSRTDVIAREAFRTGEMEFAFYEQDGGLHSPEDPTPYIHTDAQLLGKTCVWIDVPASRGREEGTRSKYRTAEAEATADLVARWVALPSQPSVGAMSLYGAQTDQVLAELEVAGLARSSPEGVVVTEGRVRVGNVDAFQGREFDHVALSLARSNSNTHPVGAFGFLTLVNRLCVAMSRQRKLLVLVGDFEMFSSDLAKSSVPAIWKFAQICREDNAVQR